MIMSLEDEIANFILICRDLGIDPSIDTFTERKKIQKMFYLLNKIDDFLEIRFSWYKHGPYSPKLADIYYQVEDFMKLHNIDKYSLNSDKKQHLKKIKGLFKKIKNDPQKLEFYASLLFVYDDMIFFGSKKNEDTIKEKVRELKSHLFSEKLYQDAINDLKEFDLIN